MKARAVLKTDALACLICNIVWQQRIGMHEGHQPQLYESAEKHNSSKSISLAQFTDEIWKKPPKTALVEPFLVIQQCVEERRNFCAWASRNLQKFLLGARKYRYHRKKGHLMDKIRNAFKELGPAVFWSFELFCAEHFKNWARLHKKLLRSKQILQREKNTRQIVLHCTVHIFT